MTEQRRYLVQVAETADLDEVLGLLDGDPVHIYENAVRGFATTLSAAEYSALLSHSGVNSIAPDEALSPAAFTYAPAFLPAEPMAILLQVMAGQVSYPNRFSAPTVAAKGAGTRLYVLDTGMDITDPLLSGRAVFGWDVKPNGTGVDRHDTHHGQGVANVAAGTAQGIATSAAIVNVRITDAEDGFALLSDLIAAMDWVATDKAAHASAPAVLNLSFSGVDTPATLYQAAVNYLTNHGVTFVQCAGNYSSRLNAATTPPNIIVVSGLRGDSKRATYTGYGPRVDVFAPSQMHIHFTDQDRKAEGTSFAAPVVAGLLCAYLEDHPTKTPAQVRDWVLNNSLTGRIRPPMPNGTPNRIASAYPALSIPVSVTTTTTTTYTQPGA